MLKGNSKMKIIKTKCIYIKHTIEHPNSLLPKVKLNLIFYDSYLFYPLLVAIKSCIRKEKKKGMVVENWSAYSDLIQILEEATKLWRITAAKPVEVEEDEVERNWVLQGEREKP